MNDLIFPLLILLPVPFLLLFLRKIYLHIIHSINSPISGQIHLRRSAGGETRLYINDCLQGISTDYKHIKLTYWWHLAQQALTTEVNDPKISGLGANTISSLIIQSKPASKITIIEHDPHIIEIAKKYFGLDTTRINTIQSDWYAYLTNQQPESYDIIINDLLTGEKNTKVPTCLTPAYLSQLQKLLRKSGLILYNIPYQATKPQFKTAFYNYLQQNSYHYEIHTIKHPYGFHNDELTITC
jgi:spermidine synthase